MSYHGVTRIIGSGGVWEWRSGGVEELKSGGMKSLVPENFCIISKSVHPGSLIRLTNIAQEEYPGSENQ